MISEKRRTQTILIQTRPIQSTMPPHSRIRIRPRLKLSIW